MSKKRIISGILVLFMVLSLFPSNLSIVYAEEDEDTNMSEMDALSALGIDSSAAPEGFDENDTSNPYGKDTMTVNPVSELYVVGLSGNTNALDSQIVSGLFTEDGQAKVDKTTVEKDIAINPQYLRGTLYGHDSDYTNASSLPSISSNKNIAQGNSTIAGKYFSDIGSVKIGGIPVPEYIEYLQEDGYSVDTSVSSDSTGSFSIAASKVVSGNFDGNKEGKIKQAALVYAGDFSEDGGLYMRVGDIEDGTYGHAINLVPTTKSIGNPSDKIDDVKENFMTDPYLMQNYLQVTTGDYDGDGVDEIAVFVPEYNNSRIEVYKLKTTTGQSDTAYKNPEQWEREWTYSLREDGYVSNMVSLVSGDFNEDGVSDIGATWGYYYGPNNNNGSKAVVMFGAKGKMLQEAQEFDLDYGQSEIVRASFTFGDLTGSGSEVLILGGQYSEDLENNIISRYVALYSWNGTEFVANTVKNFKLFEKDDDDNYIHTAMAGNNDKFYSSSLCPSNIAVVKRGLSESPYLYLDSLLIEYGDSGLEIVTPLDQSLANEGNEDYYVEYGAVSGDFSGLGYETIATMQQTTSETIEHIETIVEKHWYYKNWWHRWIDKKTYYYTTSDGEAWIEFKPAKTSMVVIDSKDSKYYKSQVDTSTSICLPNTDDDTSYMRYTGTHYFKYTDPEVLAVLASPPYFSDLLNRDDLSASYAESSTSYASTKGSGGGETYNSTIEVGAYVSVEQEFSVFGVVVASVEAEQAITRGFTYETEKTSTLEQTVSYTATAGEDMIAFYSIPLEVYEYTAYTPNGDGTYEEQKMTVNIPHIAAVQLLSLDDYENIAKDYDILPQISGTVLTHTLGDPTTYPSSPNGYLDAVAYTGDWARVGWSSNDGGASIGQEISMTEEESTSYSVSTKLESKVGAGAGGVKVGVTFGSDQGAGWVTTSTSGNSFSGEMQNMPIEAKEYGYSHCWKIFSYLYDDGKVSFPVVNYLVTDITAPSPLPDDFEQNVAKTTDEDIAFTWSYDKMVAGFQIYRYYEFPDGSGSYELKFIPMTDGVYDSEDDLYHFEFIDSNLSPYTDYQYQIQTVRASVPNNSIPSEVVSARTKTDVGYPEFTLDGLDEDGYLRIYPDSISDVSALITNSEIYKGISYQWQKLVDGVWTDMAGKTAAKLTFTSSGSADQGSYRCRTNVIYFDSSRGDNYYISAYSDVFETKYSKRTPAIVQDSFNATTFDNDSDGKGVNIDLKFVSGNTNHYTAPQGNVTFTVTGTDYVADYTVALVQTSETNDDEKFISKASLNIGDLPDGVYEVSGYYGGNRVFQSLSTDEDITFLVGDSGYQLILQNADVPSVEYTYGDMITPTLKYLTNDDGDTSITTVAIDVDYKINNALVTIDEDGDFRTPNIGTYTIEAELTGSGIVAERNFAVLQREITVEAIQTADTVGKGEVEIKLPELRIESGAMAFTEELSDLNLIISAINTAGNPVTLDNDTEPGNYTIIGTTSGSTNPVVYNNYKVSYLSGIYTIIGQTYQVNIAAEQYKNKDVGTITLSNTDDGKGAEFSAGTELLFYATPYDGYEVDSWSALAVDSGNEIVLDDSQFNDSKTRLSMTMNSEETSVTVRFKKSKTTLTTAKEGEGVVVCDNDPAFISGGNVNTGADVTFTATPSEGYNFKEWKIETGGTTKALDGTLNEDGSNTLTYTMQNANTVLRAIFERDSYTITLADNLEAVYSYELDGEEKEKTVNSGAKIVGDTEVLVRVRVGYEATSGAAWVVNGETVSPEAITNDGYEFNMTEDTSVLVDTTRLSFDITKVEENGTISVTVDGEDASELTDILGASRVVFTAHPAHGYSFDSYTITGTSIYTGDGVTLTIDELGSDIEVKANYTESSDYAVDVNCGNRAKVAYSLYDAFGVAVVTEASIDSGSSIDVCDGDKLKLVVTPNDGYMIDKWTIDGIVDETRSKEYTFDNISDNIDVKIETISQTSYTVNYSVDDTDGVNGNISATTDGIGFDSGFEDVGGNSKVVFTSVPNEGYMVDYWTIVKDNVEHTIKNEDGTTFIEKVLTFDYFRPQTNIVDIKVYFTDQVDHTVLLTVTQAAIEYEYTPDDATTSTSIRDGANAVFTITPETGYYIDELTIWDTDCLTTASISSEITENIINVVKNDDYSYTATIVNVTKDIECAVNAVRPIVNIQEADFGEITACYIDEDDETVNVTSGDSINVGTELTVKANPDSGYKFVVWNDFANNSKNPTTIVISDSDITLNGTFHKKSSNNSSSGLIPTPVEEENIVMKAIEDAKENSEGKKLVKIETEEKNSSGEYEQEIPKDFFEEENTILEVVTPDGTVSLPNDMFEENPAEDIQLSIDKVDSSNLDLPEEFKDKPVIDINLKVGGKKTKWKSEDKEITVAIPYTLSEDEKKDPHKVIAVYIDDDGNITPLTNSDYDAETGAIVFKTKHTSYYSIQYVDKNFEDIGSYTWAEESIEALAARGVINGISETQFAPQNDITRADFVVLITRFFGFDNCGTANFSDVDLGKYYYDAIATSKELGIITGTGDNMFNPLASISRQDMMVIIERALEKANIKEKLNKDSDKTLDDFVDKVNASDYAKDSIDYLIKKGVISGDGMNINPKLNTKRAEVAVLLYRLLGQL